MENNKDLADWVDEKENTFCSPNPLTPDELVEKYTEELNSKDND